MYSRLNFLQHNIRTVAYIVIRRIKRKRKESNNEKEKRDKKKGREKSSIFEKKKIREE